MNFLKSKAGVALTVAILLALGVVSAWRIQTRADNRSAQETKARIERDVKSSIENAAKGIKLCPLSDPGCDKR